MHSRLLEVRVPRVDPVLTIVLHVDSLVLKVSMESLQHLLVNEIPEHVWLFLSQRSIAHVHASAPGPDPTYHNRDTITETLFMDPYPTETPTRETTHLKIMDLINVLSYIKVFMELDPSHLGHCLARWPEREG